MIDEVKGYNRITINPTQTFFIDHIDLGASKTVFWVCEQQRPRQA